MAIQFARIQRVSRSNGKNACCKGAYNARAIIRDEKTNIIYNFSDRGDNVYHNILLPNYVNLKFKNPSILMNAIERAERKDNSQLVKEFVLALPDEDNISLEIKKEMVHEFISRNKWVQEGLGIQIDIHKPHEDEKNWHAHLLITTRRFSDAGLDFAVTKARDLDPQVRGGRLNTYVKSKDEINLGKLWAEVQNDIFKNHGLENRVDLIGTISQEHIGPLRMRSSLNQAVDRNIERQVAEIDYLESGSKLLDKVTNHMSVFSKNDLVRAAKCVSNLETRTRLVEDALSNKGVIELFNSNGTKTQYFTTDEVRAEEEKILRLSSYVANLGNVFKMGKIVAKADKIDIDKVPIINDKTSNDEISFSDKPSFKHIQELIELARISLSIEQHIALTELITSNPALRILRGRAGVGKSYVLSQIAIIAKAGNINVIGLAPTHKAKEALSSAGFECSDTIKGMLFKLHNARFSLPKHSLLVVDEAGMIGNDDYQELFRVAATRKCNIILSGDERQLASVGRGGMFEIFADKYGSSTILDIKRQTTAWGKLVATSFSKGDVRSGISILAQEQRINWQASSIESMEALLADWHKSNEPIGSRLILAVKNKDIAALNHGVRQYLKYDGKLTGLELEVGGNHYMKGDVIIIQKTNKELGVTNGDLAEILEVTKERFTVSIQNVGNDNNPNTCNDARVIEFNPAEYSSFRHGYATTIFKAQGGSIKDVYVFHDGFAGLRNSYVALSRHIIELKLYVNNKTTAGIESLIKQLSYDPEMGSSLNHLTAKELEERELDAKLAAHPHAAVRAINSAFDFIAKTATKIKDKYLPASEYYNYREPLIKTETVNHVIDRIYEENQNIGFTSTNVNVDADLNEAFEQDKLVVGSDISNIRNNIRNSINITNDRINNILTEGNINDKGSSNVDGDGDEKIANSIRTSLSAKDRFYAKADYARAKAQRVAELQTKWDNQSEELRKEASFKAENIAMNLLGVPNKKLSNGRELRFGENGKIAVRISGNKAGTWYDFSSNKGGDMFTLVQDVLGYDFKGAADYLKQTLGIELGSDTNISYLQLVHDHTNSNIAEEYIKAKQTEEKIRERKQNEVNKLVQRSKELTKASIAFKYLSNTRGINCNNYNIGKDVKTAGIYVSELNRYLPTLIAYARDNQGNITGGQQIFLQANGTKADIATPKKSFGRISGSFVNLGDVSDNLHFSDSNNSISTKDKDISTEDISNDINNQDSCTDSNQNMIDNFLVDKPEISDIEVKITIIAEGLETALSIKQALSNDLNNENREHRQNRKNRQEREIKVLCSLGVNNICNYRPRRGEKIIIAADNDGEHSLTAKTIDTAKFELTNKGAFVEIVRPSKEGDFNDILKDKNLGEQEIQNNFSNSLASHSAVTLVEYFRVNNQYQLSKQEKEDIAYIAQYEIDEEKIIDAYRSNPLKGNTELETVRKSLTFANSFICEHKYLIDEANRFGAKIDNNKLAASLLGKNHTEMESHLMAMKDRYYISHYLDELAKDKQKATTPQKAFTALKQEQEFLAGLHNNGNIDYNSNNNVNVNPSGYSTQLLERIQKAYEFKQSNEIDRLYDSAHYAYREKIISADSLTERFKAAHPLDVIHNDINSICHKYHCGIINDHYKMLTAGQSVMHQGHKFDCIIKYLEYWKDNVNHNMLPIKHIEQAIEHELDHQTEIEQRNHELDL